MFKAEGFLELVLAFALVLAVFKSLIKTYFLESNEQNEVAYHSFCKAVRSGTAMA